MNLRKILIMAAGAMVLFLLITAPVQSAGAVASVVNGIFTFLGALAKAIFPV